jgi:choline-sulfatase
MAPNGPNILMIMGDQHPVFMTGCYGHKLVQTPSMDSIAARGVAFDAAYCPSPLCAPSRAAMMAGRHSSTIEVWDNASPFRSDWPTFAHSFRAAGYQTILCGKMHFAGPDQHHGFEERWTQDIYPSTFDWTLSNREKVFVKPRGTGQGRHRVHESGIAWTPDMDYDKDIDLPETPAKPQESGHPIVQWVRAATHLEEPVPDEVCIRARHATLGRISMVDDYVGRLLKTLAEIGKSDDTIVLYTSDHGDMMGEHGMWFKCTAYEWSSRVPFMICGPGIPHGRRNAPASLLDLGPTLCSLAGIEPVYTVTDGRDLAGIIRGEEPDGTGEAIVEYYGDGTWRGWRTIRRGILKLTYAPGFEPSMFDLEKDPGEWNDVAGDPAYREDRDSLVSRLLENWNPEECDERRYLSEERRLAVLKAHGPGKPESWAYKSPPVPHPGTGHSGKSV